MNAYKYENAKLQQVIPPKEDNITAKVVLNENTLKQRKQKILARMKEKKLDTIVIYSDLEHGSNFEYIAGFVPRFEEALLIMHQSGQIYYMLGNENLKMAQYAHHKGNVIHVPQFSLPNQPMYDSPFLVSLFKKAEIKFGNNIGIIGWKLFTSSNYDNAKTFDVPHFIVDALLDIVDDPYISNAADIFIGNNGARTYNNANEIVHYAFGAQLASKAMIRAMNEVELGKNEMEVASKLDLYGQPKSVVTIAAAGQRFENANLYPTTKKLELSDALSLTIGYKGGLQSRSGYICRTESQLPSGCTDYLNRVVKPYFTAITAWIENIHVGMTGNDLYQLINTIFPKENFGWSLNPGHLIATEEWMASPIFDGSADLLKSGMMLQIDIIPSVVGYAGVNAECGIALADQKLKEELSTQYPEFMTLCQGRKQYIHEQLGINVSDDVLILSNATLYLRPFFLNKNCAMTFNK